MNLLTADKAKLVTGPVVSSDLMTSRKGPKKIKGSKIFKSSILLSTSFKSKKAFNKGS